MPGDSRADDEHLLDRRHADRLERLRAERLLDPAAHEADRLAGGALLVVRMRPRALLPDVDLHVLEGIHAGALRDVAEGHEMELRRTGGDDHAVELLLLDVLHHLLLRGVGAGEERRLRDRDAELLLDRLADLVDVDVVGDVAAAVADIDAYLLSLRSVIASS